MTEHDHVNELLAVYALGGLEPEEVKRVEAHLAECPTCRNEAGEALALVGLIAQSMPTARPSETARAQMLNRIGMKPGLRVERPARPRLQGAVAALGALVVTALLGWNILLNNQLNHVSRQVATQAQAVEALSQQATQQAQRVDDLQRQTDTQQQVVGWVTSPSTQAYDLASQGPIPDAGGRVYVDEDSRKIVVVVQHLRPLGPEQTYQLWIMTPAGLQPSELFTVNQKGWGMTWVEVPPALANFSGIGVSVEPAGGSQTPTEVVLAGGT